MLQDNLSIIDFEVILGQYNIGSFISRRYIDSAIENLNYEVRTTKGKFLLKVFENKDIHALIFQNRLIHYLGSHKVKVPLLVLTKNGKDIIDYNGRYASIFEFIEGDYLGKLSSRSSANLAKEIAALHEAFLKYKPRKWHGETYYSPQDKKLFRGKKLRKSIIHGDLGKTNILVKGDAVRAILDFNDVSYNYLIADLAVLIASVFVEKGNDKYYPPFIQEYEKTIKLTNDERILLPHFIQIRINGIVEYLSAVIKNKKYKPQQLKHIEKGLKEYQKKLLFPRKMG